MGLGAGVLAAAAVLAVGSPPGQGVNLTAYARDAYTRASAREAITELRGMGVRQIALVPTWYMDDASDSTVAPDPQRTPTDASLVELMRAARNAGMSVLLKPHIDLADGTFRGEIQPADAATWWASYEDMVDHYATLAERGGAQALTVGVELKSMSGDTSAFQRLIAGARDRFGGTLTYAANWDEVDNVQFWGDLDAIGVDAYYPLARAPGASVDELVRAWRPIIDHLQELSDTTGKPLVLTELGYAARPDAAVNPSGAGDTVAPDDVGAQETAYQAALRAWQDTDLDSIYWWDWPADPADALGDAFTPRNRPAADVIEDFAHTDDGGWLSSVPWPLLVIVAIWTVVALGFLAILKAAGGPSSGDESGGRRRLIALPSLPRLPSPRALLARLRPPTETPEPPAAAEPAPDPQPPAPVPAPVPPPPRASPLGSLTDGAAAPPAQRPRFSRRTPDPLAQLEVVDLDRLAQVTCTVLGVEMAAVLVRAPDDPRSLITAGEAGVSLRGRRWSADAGVAGMVLDRAEPVAIHEYGELRARIGGDQTIDLHTAAAAPLIVHRALRGALSVGTTDPDRRLTAGDLELLGALAELVAAALAQPGGPDQHDSVRAQIEGLAAAMEAREPDERRRTTSLATLIGRVADRMLDDDERARAELQVAARLHDVGMLRVPSAPLRKPGPLAGGDRRLVDLHPAWGCDLLAEVPGLQGVAAIVRFHHERWDGTGYPHALAGERIPLESRILAACEAWTAITFGRPHAPARSPEHAVEELRRDAGAHFDPAVVEILAAVSTSVPRPLPKLAGT
jgi:HD-GYP domain-containing protein (c-di-GMP phosphodiesterase class II)